MPKNVFNVESLTFDMFNTNLSSLRSPSRISCASARSIRIDDRVFGSSIISNEVVSS